MKKTNDPHWLKYAIAGFILILITDLYIFPILEIMQTPIIKIGPKGWQTLLLFALLAGAVYFYFSQKKRAIPLLPAGDVYTATITIEEYTHNEIGDVDGLIARLEEHRLLLKFPPHTAYQVIQAAPKEALAEVRYSKGKTPQDLKSAERPMKLETIRNLQSGQSVNIAGVLPPLSHESNGQKEIMIAEKHFNLDKKGQVNGFLSGTTFVEIKPPIMKNLMELIQQANHISVRGIPRTSKDGFVNLYNREVIRATSITLDSNTYSIY